MNIHLLHTNDIHSHLENHMKAGALLRRRRAELQHQGQPVLTFDIGDAIDRVRPETEATGGLVNAAIMDALGYDGWVFGNNEGLTIPARQWTALRERAGCPVFGTNIRKTGEERYPGFVDWKTYTFDSLRIGVFGLTPQYEKPYEHLQVRATEPFAEAARVVSLLRSEQHCDVVVLLSHLGIWNDRKLAAQVAGIDVILGAHSHTWLETPEKVGTTVICQAGKDALGFGHTTVRWDPDRRTVRAVDGEIQRISPADPLDAAMLSAYRAYLPDVDAALAEPIGEIASTLPVCYAREAVFPNALADALYTTYSCDLAMIMAGALNASLLPGLLTRGTLHAACSTPTRPLLMTLKGEDILAILEASLDTADERGRGFGFRGSVVGYLALSNAEVHIAVSESGKRRVQQAIIGGVPAQPDKMYRVATCEYLWLTPLLKTFQRGTDIDIRPPLLREVLADYLARPGRIAESRKPRYHVVTE